jgi:hypothetical protein
MRNGKWEMKNSNCYSYIFEVSLNSGSMSDVAQPTATSKPDSSHRKPEVVITSSRQNDEWEILNAKPTFSRSADEVEVWTTWRDLRYYFSFGSSVLPVGEGHHSLQPLISDVVVGRATSASGDLENVGLALGILHLSFTFMELILLPVYESCCLFPVISYVARHRSNFHCLGRPRKFSICIRNFSAITCSSGLISTFGRRLPYLISVNHVR